MQNAYQWIDMIVASLFQPDIKRLGEIVTQLNEENSRRIGIQYFGFMHHGKRYLDPRYESQRKVLSKYPMPTLALELHDRLAQFDSDNAQLERDKARIKQALTPLLINCNDLQDIRNSLPECLIHLVPQISHLQRTLENNTVFIESDVYAVRAYGRALPLIQAYSVAGLVC